jgi:hypothetical protein
MEHELTPDAREAIDRLSYEIAMKRHLDFDGRKEITGHIEDKVLGYLNAEETLTEDDALLLAREHFGGQRISVEFDPTGVLNTGRALLHDLAVGVLPYGIALFIVGLSIDLFGITLAPRLFPDELSEYFIFAMAGGVIVILLLSRSLTERVHRWARSLEPKQLVKWSALVLMANAFTTIPSLRHAALTELPQELLHIWSKGPSDNMVVVFLLVVMAAVYCGYLALTYRFLAWSAQKYRLFGAFCGLLFWYGWHVALFAVHVVAAPLMIWMMPTLRAANSFRSFYWFTWDSRQAFGRPPETWLEKGIEFVNTLFDSVVLSLRHITQLWSEFSQLLAFNRYILLIGILAFALWWARHPKRTTDSESIPSIQSK